MEICTRELKELLHLIQIPLEDCDTYVEELKKRGYDTSLSFVEDVTLDELTFMKPGHKKRVEALFKARRGISSLDFGMNILKYHIYLEF